MIVSETKILLSTERSNQITFRFALPLLLTACLITFGMEQSFGEPPEEPSLNNSKTATNVLLAPWSGPYGGTPPWRSISPENFEDAFSTAMEMENRDLEQISLNAQLATFANTIVALEKAGAAMDRLQSMYYVHTSNLNLGPMSDIETAIEPKLSAHQDSIMQNQPLFARVQKIYESETAKKDLTPPQLRLLDKVYKRFVRQGALLGEEDKKELSRINIELASLFTRFSQNVLAAEQTSITVEDASRLSGVPDNIVTAMEKTSDGSDGGNSTWEISNTRSAVEPVLTYADDRALREQVWRAFYDRCDGDASNGDQQSLDNNEIISAILLLRARRAKLLGYETHAHWRLEPQMAKTPEQAMALMMSVWPKAVAAAQQEVVQMQAVADAELSDPITIAPWDYRYYAEKVRKQKYDLDFNEVKPYLQLDKLREGMMWSAEQMFGFQFRPIESVEVFHPDVRVWEVRKGDELIGLWYFDPFARAGKRSGAWMTDYRPQSNIDAPIIPLVSNNSNFVKGKPGEPVLVSWDDAVTLFHEFGHALHGLCSQCQYPSQSGTSVARDFVEFPSQLFESWLTAPEVLAKFAIHHQSGQPMPAELVNKIEKAATFNQGFGTVEYLASAIIDMKLHLAGEVPIEPGKFEKKTLAEIGMPDEIVMRHRTPHFSHVFAGDSYSAGYYSYLWAEALTADAAEAFEDANSFFDPQTAERLFNTVLSVGDTVDPANAFRNFRGRDVDPAALFRKRGFPVGQ